MQRNLQAYSIITVSHEQLQNVNIFATYHSLYVRMYKISLSCIIICVPAVKAHLEFNVLYMFTFDYSTDTAYLLKYFKYMS